MVTAGMLSRSETSVSGSTSGYNVIGLRLDGDA